MSIKQHIWFRYIWRRVLLLCILYYAEKSRFEIDDLIFSIANPYFLFFALFLIESILMAFRYNDDNPVYNKKHALRKVKVAKHKINTIFTVYTLFLLIFLVSNSGFKTYLHGEVKRVKEYVDVSRVSLESLQATDYHLIKSATIAKQFNYTHTQSLLGRRTPKYLSISVWGTSPIQAHQTSQAQYHAYLVQETRETFSRRSQKLSYAEVKPTIDTLAKRAYQTLHQPIGESGLCLKRLTNLDSALYQDIIHKARLPAKQYKQSLFFEKMDAHRCKESKNSIALYFLILSLVIEALLIQALISAREDLAKTEAKYKAQA